jgi:hypothetical protein
VIAELKKSIPTTNRNDARPATTTKPKAKGKAKGKGKGKAKAKAAEEAK